LICSFLIISLITTGMRTTPRIPLLMTRWRGTPAVTSNWKKIKKIEWWRHNFQTYGICI